MSSQLLVGDAHAVAAAGFEGRTSGVIADTPSTRTAVASGPRPRWADMADSEDECDPTCPLASGSDQTFALEPRTDEVLPLVTTGSNPPAGCPVREVDQALAQVEPSTEELTQQLLPPLPTGAKPPAWWLVLREVLETQSQESEGPLQRPVPDMPPRPGQLCGNQRRRSAGNLGGCTLHRVPGPLRTSSSSIHRSARDAPKRRPSPRAPVQEHGWDSARKQRKTPSAARNVAACT